MRPADVLILGGGVAGLATAWHLARREPRRIVLVEREPGLGRLSSGQNAAILRTSSGDPVLEAMAREGADFLRRPPNGFAPTPLVDPCGLLLFTASDDQAPEAVELTRAEARSLAPHVRSSAKRALHFPTDGRIDIAAVIDALARGAREAGVSIRTGCGVRNLATEAGRVVGVELDDGSAVRAATTVLAAGGWAGRLGGAAGSQVELRPTRRHLLVTAPDDRIDRGWPVVWDETAGFYCRPESAGMLLCACDQVEVDPDACATDPDVREQVAAKAARLLPAFADAGAAHFWCGMRTLTADDRFAIGPDPDLAGLFWVAGLGGHGMTCGPAAGRVAARLIDGEEDPLGPAFDPARLARSTV